MNEMRRNDDKPEILCLYKKHLLNSYLARDIYFKKKSSLFSTSISEK